MAKKSPVNNVDETVETKESIRQYNATNQLKLKIDNLKTFHPLTENQKTFFDAYRQGDYFIALLGSPGVGKCQGEDVEVNLLVSDDLYEKLTAINLS